MKDIQKIDDWDEVTKGLYRFHVQDNLDLEIHVIFHNKRTDILSSNCRIYSVGEYVYTADILTSDVFFEREFLMVGPLMSCLEKAKLYCEDINSHIIRKKVD